MKHLKTYLEDAFATPANTMGMGNPGEVGPDTLSEPIATAKSEVEKDKKKRKKKLKSLAESLFDKDLSKQRAHIGDAFVLDEWTIPARGDDYAFVDDILNYGIKPDCGVCLGKLKWQKILKPINSFPQVTNNQCMGSYFLKYVTELILCCETVKQIPDVVKNYTMECRNNPNKYKNPKDKKFVEGHLFKDVQVSTLDGLNGEALRMVVIKFIMENEDDNLICVTFKKRD